MQDSHRLRLRRRRADQAREWSATDAHSVPPAEALAETASEQQLGGSLGDLQYIRQTMERASSFTAVSGLGTVAMGFLALAAAWLTAGEADLRRWLSFWIVTAIACIGISIISMLRKARRIGEPFWSTPARKFLFSFLPPMLIGAMFTFALAQRGEREPVPALWMLMYGCAVITGGAFSVRVLPVMGLCFMGLGAAALFAPWSMVPWLMAAGFGVLHIIFGAWIAKRHGG